MGLADVPRAHHHRRKPVGLEDAAFGGVGDDLGAVAAGELAGERLGRAAPRGGDALGGGVRAGFGGKLGHLGVLDGLDRRIGRACVQARQHGLLAGDGGLVAGDALVR